MNANLRQVESRPTNDRNSRAFVPTLGEIFWGPMANGFRRLAQWRKRGVLGQELRARRRRAMRFEPLEPRILLSADMSYAAAAGHALDATLTVGADDQGAAILRLIDNDESNTILAEQAIDQDINFAISGNDQADRLTIDFDAAALAYAVSFTFDGGAGDDTLIAADNDNTWVITGEDAGTLNGQSFNDVENLTGGAADDAFIFYGGSISGTIDGGEGINTFDYSAQTAGVTVDLEAASATGVAAWVNVTNVVGGAGSDTLIGSDQDSTWAVTGANAGTVGSFAFAQVENLSGGSGADTFVVSDDATLDGILAGGLGSDELVGANRANLWVIDGTNAGTLNDLDFADIENLRGGDLDDVFELLAAGGLAGTAVGGAGTDRFRGPERKTVWRFTGTGSGNADGVGFAGMEVVQGGSDEDSFAFDDGVDFGGTVDGGEGGDTLDYAASTAPVTVDLAAATASGVAGFVSIESVTGGAASDTLKGPAEDSTWIIDDANAGNVAGVSFSSFENLEGAADNEDTFVFEASGSLSGVADGGLDGFDSLDVNGSFDTIIFTPTGPHSGYVDRDGDVIEYAGLEPVNAGSATNVVFNGDGGTGNVDTWTLEDSTTAGKLQLRSTTPGQIETTEFAATAATITLHMGAGNDSVTIASAGDSGFAGTITVYGDADNDTLTVSGYTGDVTFNGGIGNDVLTGGVGSDTLIGGDGNDTLTGRGGNDTLNGGANNDTYMFGNSFGTDTITDSGGIDTINFNSYSDSLTALSATGATGSDGSTVSYSAGTIENVVGADTKLQLTSAQKTQFLVGLDSLITWAKALNDYAELGLPLPIIAGNVEVGVGQALQIAEALDQIRLRLLNAIDWSSNVTTQQILTAISGYTESAIQHLDRAILGDVKNAVITAADAMSFALKLNGTALPGISLSVSDMTSGGSGGGAVDTLTELRDLINGKILATPALLGQVQAVISEGRLAIQSTSSEFTSLAVSGSGAAISKLGFKSSFQSVLDTALEGLGDLSINFGSATLAINVGAGGIPEMELHLAPSASRTTNFAVDLGADAGNAGIAFNATASLAATATFSANLDLRLVLGASPSFLLDLSSLNASLAMNAAVNADISIGFLGAHVSGNVNMAADPGLSFTPVSLNLAQLNAGNIGAISPVFAPSSSLNLDLDVSLTTPLNGLAVPSTANILITSTDLFTGDRDDISVTFTDLDQLFNFDNMNAAGLAGLLGQLAGWLESMGGNRLNDIEIPFTNSTVGDVLDFKDMISDLLLFDDGDSSILPKKKLVNDLNNALSAAGLSSQLRVEGDGTKLKLVATDPGLTNFSVTASGSNWLGFGSQSTTNGTLVASLAATLPSVPATPGDAVLHITIDGKVTDVTVTEAALLDNLIVGLNIPKLLYGDNSPTFRTAQDFASRLSAVLTAISGLSVPLAYDATDKTLSFSLDLTGTLFNADLPLNFNLDLSPIADLSTTSSLHLDAHGRLMLTIGIDLEDPEASTLLTAGTTLASLHGGDGIDIKTEPSLMGSADVVSVVDGPNTYYGRFNTNAVFQVSINGGSAQTVTITGIDSAGTIGIDASTNKTIIDLVVDVNKALRLAGLQSVNPDGSIADTSQLRVDFTGNRLLFTGGNGVTSFTITPSSPSDATKLGLPAVGTANNYDVLIKTHDGAPHNISLDGAVDIGDVIQRIVIGTGGSGTINKSPVDPAAIEGLTFGSVIVGYNEARDGLKLTDNTTGGATFAVTALNGSRAALDLRIVAVDGLDDGGEFDGIIDGGQIASVTLADRFYVEDAIVSGDLAISGAIDASAVFGDFVGINLLGTANLNAGLEAGLKNPTSGELGGRVTLAQLIRGLSDIGSIVETPNFSGGGSITLGVSTTPDITSLIPLGGTPQVTINLADFGNPFTASFVSEALSVFDFGDLGFDITLASDNSTLDNLTVTVSLSDLLTNGNLSLTDLAGDLAGAIQAAFDANATLQGLFGVGNVPQLVSASAVASILGNDPDKLVLNALEDVVVGGNHFKITNFTLDNATGAAKALFGLDLGDAFDFLADLTPDIGFDFSDLDDLLKFDNLDFNFSAILDALILLSDFLDGFEEFGFLNEDLPLLDMSINDVLDFADRFNDAVNEALANPAGTIQTLEAKLKEALGLAPSSTAISLTLDHWDNDTPDTGDDIDLLKIGIHLDTGFSETANIAIPEINIPVLSKVFDLGGSADLAVGGSIGLDLDLGINLANPLGVYVYNTTGLFGSIAASGSNLEFMAALGPLGLYIREGTASISGTIAAGLDLNGDGVVDNGTEAIDRILIGSLLGSLSGKVAVDVDGGLNIDLPTYFPTKNASIGSFGLDLASVDFDTLSASAITSALTLPTFSLDFLTNLSLFDSIMLAVDGIDAFLGGLQDVMDGEVFGLEIPFIGDKLSAAGGFIEDFRSDFVDPFRSFLESADDFQRNFTDPSENFVSQLLFDLLGPSSLTGKAFSLDLLKPLAADGAHPDNPDSPLTPNGVEDFIKLSTDGSSYVQWNFSLGDIYGVGTEIDMDLGIPGLGMEADGNIGISFDWDLDFGFGLSLADGFYLDISDSNELFANVDITLPSSFTGRLAFLQLRAEDAEVYADHDGMTNLALAFAVDIGNKKDTASVKDDKLAMSEFGQIDFRAGVAAEAVAELMLYLEVNSSDLGLSSSTAAGIPKIQSEFVLDWGIGTYNVLNPENSTFAPIAGIGDAITDGLHYVGFSHVSLDAGSFLSDVLGPIVSTVKEITDPLQPLIDVITAPIPVLSDLGPPITLLDIAAAFGEVDPGLIYSIADIISLINRIPDPSATGTLLIDFGDFDIFDNRDSTVDKILTDLTNPNLDFGKVGGGGLLDGLLNTNGLADAAGNFLGNFDSLLGSSSGNAASKSTMQALSSGEAGSGFDFPLFNNPSQIFGLLTGQPATLVTYDMAPLYFEFDWSTFFSIFGPLGVSINIGFSADIDFAFGYDTLGIQEFIEGDFQNPAALLNGFYVSDTDMADGSFGTDVPEIVLAGNLWAAAELNLGVARAGVGGGIFAEIQFDLFDPNHDGKVRINEIIKNIENQFVYGDGAEKLLAPLAVFDVTGEITAKLFAFLKIDLFFFEIDETFDITPEITLLEFDIDFERVPVLATELENGDLVLNMGRFAKDRMVDDLGDSIEMLVDQPEDFEVEFLSANHVRVRATNLGTEANYWQEYDVTGKIIAYGDEGDDSIIISGVASSVGYLIEGGVGDDIITLHALANGAAVLRGDDGVDTITGGAGADQIWGGRGIDTIRAGGGNDIVFGDDGEITTGTDANAMALLKFDDEGDFLYGEAGDDIMFGGGGDDLLEGGDNNDVLIGDAGRVIIASKLVSDTNTGVRFGDDKLFGNAGTDKLYGGKGDDVMDGGAGTDTMYGEDGNDVLYGGGGGDFIHGADGNDVIWGKRDPAATAGNFDATDATADGGDTIEGNAGEDLIYGEGGNDTIHGNSGADDIYGGEGADTIFGEGGPDLIYGGHGPDTIDGGADDDIIFGDDGEGDFAGTYSDEPSPNAVVYGNNLPLGLPEHYEFGVTKSNNFDTLTDRIDTIYSYSGSDFIDGQSGPDVYIIRLQGADNQSFINVYDSGIDVADTDYIQIFGTMYDDNFLLRASASADGLAFVALLNEAPNAERINYWNLERMLITGSFGDDYFAVDDVRAETTITGDVGDDRFQVGQLYRSPRDAGATQYNNIELEDVFATIETTIGWLSDGINRPMTIYGGVGNDYFTVFHNKAVLSLFGEDGDDTFLIKAFALAGSQEPFRDRTDVSGGAGADLVQYAMNAPVNIDGGDGFDTVIIIGTEFGDDFVITKDGVYGAGLNVNFVNIESLSVDGAEGDDRFYVQSTSEKFITQIFGGLGSDTFNMSGDIPPVISNDLQGHSGVIRHSIETDLSSTNYDETIVDGVAVNVYDNDPGLVVVVNEADGFTTIMEGGYTDDYSIVLSRAPISDVYVQVLAPVQTQDQKERGSKLFRIDSATKTAFTPDGTALTLKFTAATWDTPQIVTVSALDNADAAIDFNDDALEGDATGFINHVVASDVGISGSPTSIVTNNLSSGDKETVFTVGGTPFVSVDPSDLDGLQNLGGFLLLITDGPGAGQSLRVKTVDAGNQITLWGEFRPDYQPDTTSLYRLTKDIEAVRAVTVTVHDDDDAGVIIGQSDNSTDLFEAGKTDQITVRLARQPVDNVIVTLNSNDGQLSFDLPVLTFTSANWSTPQVVTVTAVNDSLVEGFHHSLISFSVASPANATATGDVDTDVVATELRTLSIPEAYVGLEHRPKLVGEVAQVSEVWVENLATHVLELRDATRWDVISNKVVFLTAGGKDYDFLTGDIKVVYTWVKAGYDGLEVKPILTNIADNEVPQVLITETGGGTNVIENEPGHTGQPWTDTYDVVLTKAPTGDVYVKVTVDQTKTSAGRNIHWGQQVEISSSAPDAVDNGDGTFTLKFTTMNWNTPQVVSVTAFNDGEYDGDDTQYFAPKLHTVSDIQGPIYLFGEGGSGSVVASNPLMLHYELNVMRPTDVVNSVSGDGTTMTVNKATLLADAFALNEDVLTVADLVTQKMTVTIADGVEEIGQFRLIVGAVDNGTTVTLTLNEAWDLSGGDVAEDFSAISKYAVSRMSENFFAIEAEQIDYVFVYNEDSPADNIGARAGILQDSTTVGFEGNSIVESFITNMDGKWLSGLGMGAENLLIGGYYHPRGITYGDMEVVEINMGDGADEFTITDTHVRSDGYQTWTFINTGRGNDTITATLNSDLQVLAAGAITAGGSAGETVFTTDQTFPTTTASGVDLAGYLVKITGGTGVGQQRVITGNTTNGLTVATAWDIGLDATSQFEILGAPLFSGFATADTPETGNTLTDTSTDFGTANGLVGRVIEIIDGAGAGTKRVIIANTDTTLTVSSAWNSELDDTSAYRIYGEQDGPIAVNLQEGTDKFYGSASSIPLVVFGGAGVDHIEGGAGDDILFGDNGRIEYVNEDGKIVTLLGLARERLDPQYIDAFTANTLTDTDGAFPVKTIDMQGLEGFMLSIPDGRGFGQRAQITLNTSDTLTVTPDWQNELFTAPADFLLVVPGGYDPIADFDATDPQANPTKYRVSLIPEDQTDGVTRDPSLIIAIDPTIGDDDVIIGNAGDDRVFGGAGSDTINGNDGDDTIFGDHGRLDYTPAVVGGTDGPQRGDFVPATLNRARTTFDDIGGGDTIYGDGDNDIIFGGYNNSLPGGPGKIDTLYGNTGDDIVFGDNGVLTFIPNDDTPGNPRDVYLLKAEALARGVGGEDVISGNAGGDLIIGGAAGDTLYGDNATASAGDDDGEDIVIGDNAAIDFTAGAAGRWNAYGSSINLIETTDTTETTGGADTIHGNAMGDILIGGVGGDTLYGDAPTQGGHDGDDLILGDNGEIDFGTDTNDLDRVSSQQYSAADGTTVLGGADTISGDWGSDTVIAGSAGDTVYGDNAGATGGVNDGEDILVGDNATILYAGDAPEYPGHATDGRLYTLGNTPITSIESTDTEEATGGADTISGNAQTDVVIGGVGGDTLYGDAADEGAYDQADVLIGDNGFVDFTNGDTDPTTVELIQTRDVGLGGSDTIHGNDGDDMVLGGKDGDVIHGNANDDLVIGDFGQLLFTATETTSSEETYDKVFFGSIARVAEITDNNEGGGDTIYGDGGEDILIGGAGSDNIDGDADDDLIFGDNVSLTRTGAAYGDDTNPRFRTLIGFAIYGEEVGVNNGETLEDETNRLIPNLTGTPVWQDWDIELLDHSFAAEASTDPDETNKYGNDYIAGGANDDTIFAQLGNDIVQGDGSIDSKVDDGTPVGAYRDNANLLVVVPSLESVTDGDDYIEGNGGNDVIFGNLGQDDILGGNSDLFSLVTPELRPDGSDLIFGGAGTDISRNDIGDANEDDTSHVVTTTPSGHARDADMILGDNGNIYRLVSVSNTTTGATSYLEFHYDQSSSFENRGTLRIIPRAAELLDYTPGGVLGAAPASDIGDADELHGESGDDFIYGQKGADVLFGEGQNDDLIGGYGNDWFSGGTGDDGVLGDDGRIYTSRNNSTVGETLYGVAPLLASDPSTRTINGNVLNEVIATPGSIQQAKINVEGELKRTVNLTPFSVDPIWNADADEFDGQVVTHHSDDIIYGGLGSDWLHGGSGDDAISGAEALPEFYAAPVNDGDVLRYSALKAGEFAAYDEFDPLHKVEGFLLNFDASEGVLRAGGSLATNGNKTMTVPDVYDDGADKIFGDLGNDWLVGGTGRDDLYGGWGDDLLNVDDNHSTNSGANDQPDTHPTYEDRAYGGAGRDVLIANTGGDRLIDWVGEFNSYIVPFAPFGMGTVSRTMQPQLAEFLYALSASDGADPTRAADIGSADPARNGEPYGELGVVRQQDFAWQAQTGAPDDPQAGNIPGGPRDVLRSATFDNPALTGFFADSGTWSVQKGVLKVTATSLGGDAVAIFDIGDALPGYFELQATVLANKPTGGWNANSYIIFDYQAADDFKFAGVDVSINKLVMGHRDATGWHVDEQSSVKGGVKAETYFNLLVAVNGVNVTLRLDNKDLFTHTYQPRIVDGYAFGLNYGLVGVGSNNARGAFDNIRVQVLPPQVTFDKTENFKGSTTLSFSMFTSGDWSVSGQRYGVTPNGATAMSLLDLGPDNLNASSYLELNATVNTVGRAGFVFDRYEDGSFKFVAIDAVSDLVIIGHYTVKSGWVNDAQVARAIDAGTDYTLGVALKGSTVSVTLTGVALNGSVALGHSFYATTVDGHFGLMATGGAASFDDVRVKTNDPAFIAPSGGSMIAASAAADTPVGQTLTQDELDAMATVAMAQWTELLGAGDDRLAAFAGVHFGIVDLAGADLGRTDGNTIVIDADAAGWGWFVDDSPAEGSEFGVRLDRNVLTAEPESTAYGSYDLLTVLNHELGHLLGFDHDDAQRITVMDEALGAGERYVLDSGGSNLAKPATLHASIDWQAPGVGNLGVQLTPYALPERAKSPWPNFANFVMKWVKGAPAQEAGFDNIGRALLGDKGGTDRSNARR